MRTLIRRIAPLLMSVAVLAVLPGCGGGANEPAATTEASGATSTTQSPRTTPDEPLPVTLPDLPGIPDADLRLIAGYSEWTPLTRPPDAPLSAVGSGAHGDAKRVWAGPADATITGPPYARGTVVVKAATTDDAITLIAIMEKVRANDADTGGWRYVEYKRPDADSDFAEVAFPESGCAACHMRAETEQGSDWVFFRK